jgi:TIR domain
MSQPRVFISLSGNQPDERWLQEFLSSLASLNISVWFDKTTTVPGASFTQELTKALRSSDLIVTVLEEDAAVRPNVYVELGIAIAMNKRMVAIVPPNLDLKLLPDPLRERSFLIKRTPQETANSVASLASDPATGEKEGSSDRELSRAAQHITNYLNANKFTKVSFDRIRERINPNYSDEVLMSLIDSLPNRFRRVRLKTGNGIGLVTRNRS